MIGVRLRLDALASQHAPEHRGELIRHLVDDYGLELGDPADKPALDPLTELTVVGEAPSHAAINQMLALSADWIRQGLIPDAHLQVGRASEIALSDFVKRPSPAQVPDQSANKM